MGKIIRLTESQLENIIEKTLIESKKEKISPVKNLDESTYISEEELNEILGFSAKEQFQKHFKEFIRTWAAKGIPEPTEEDLTAIMNAAKADGYDGKIKIKGSKQDLKNAKFIYTPKAQLKWSSGFESGGTGGHTASGGV